MKISEIIRENVEQPTRLGDLATIKTNFPDADFWVIRKGSEDKVGMPTKEFSPEHIGVKVTATDVLDPNYLRYVFQYLVQRGYFKDVARGTLRLKNIQISDVSKIPLGVKRKPKPTPNFGYKDTGYKMGEPRFKNQ